MNELIQEKLLQIFTTNDIQLLIKFDELEKRVKAMKDAKNQELINFFKENDIQSFENEDIKITYKAPFIRKTVDSQKLKDEGLYELYVKDSEVKESVVISVKYE